MVETPSPSLLEQERRDPQFALARHPELIPCKMLGKTLFLGKAPAGERLPSATR
jgi:hypothetical protein